MTKERGKINRMIMAGTFLWGLLAHGMALFNKYSFHDDAGLFTIGQTYPSGRWMLGVLGNISSFLFGSGHYSTSLFHGVLTIAFIAGCTLLLVDLFEIRNKWLIAGLSGVMVVFPVITSTFGYMFTAPYYYLGTLMGVFGAWLACRYNKWYLYLTGLLFMGCAVGVYQANVPVYVSMILLFMLKETIQDNQTQWLCFFRRAGRSILSCAGFMAVYLALNRIALLVTGMQLSSYQGINSMGRTSVKGYIERILTAYREFFSPADGVTGNMYPFSTDVIYKLMLILAGAATLYVLYHCFQKDRIRGVQALLLVLFLPLAVNFIYFMCDLSLVDSMMTYGEVLFFVYFVWILERAFLTGAGSVRSGRKIGRMLAGTGILLLMLLNIMFCRFDNICYLKAEIMQAQAISYFTALSAQIKSTEGFTADTPVVYINEYEKYDNTMASVPEFKEIHLIPYAESRIINSYSWKTTMKMWCNFDPVYGDASEYAERQEILEMPSYPSAGSIRMMDDVLIVKF